MSKEKLLKIQNLSVAFTKNQVTTPIFSGLSFDIYQGETVCLVGESGSGKSVTAKAIMQLLPTETASYPEGEIWFNGRNLLALHEQEMERIRGDQIAMVFQDALSALNPVYTIGTQMVDLIRLHSKEKVSKRQALEQAQQLLEQVDIRHADEVVKQYPFQLSGGMRQRVMIAMALSTRPRLLIADEPTTALDVTVQSNILKLIRQLKQQYDMTIMFITHDLGVVYEMADRVLVLRQGELVEAGTRDDIFTRPSHAYTKQLLNSMPRIYYQEQTPGAKP
ncbi:ATP-binding cassette domain-containing protein [Paenibacillus antibioticophila]|uniref:ATP-binding cassette domain-containing protein n=1 Tax=Paenibacillus antibioticophila TaxID=1274374 RepID=UPI0005C853A5|nr:ABC transporter ATP-binding protein [Paenibacillus antibioticophila]